MPETIWRWKNMNMMSGGTVISSTSAKSRFQRVLNWLWNVEQGHLGGRVLVPGRK